MTLTASPTSRMTICFTTAGLVKNSLTIVFSALTYEWNWDGRVPESGRSSTIVLSTRSLTVQSLSKILIEAQTSSRAASDEWRTHGTCLTWNAVFDEVELRDRSGVFVSGYWPRYSHLYVGVRWILLSENLPQSWNKKLKETFRTWVEGSLAHSRQLPKKILNPQTSFFDRAQVGEKVHTRSEQKKEKNRPIL